MTAVITLTELAKIVDKDRRTVAANLEKGGYDLESGSIDIHKLLIDYLEILAKQNDRRKNENKRKNNDDSSGSDFVNPEDYLPNGKIHLEDPDRAVKYYKALQSHQEYEKSKGSLVDIQLIEIFLSSFIGRVRAIYDSYPQEVALICEAKKLATDETQQLVAVAKSLRNHLYSVNKEFLEKFTNEFENAVNNETLDEFKDDRTAELPENISEQPQE